MDGFTVIGIIAVALWPLLSRTVAVNVVAPADVGVPASAPDVPTGESPAGNPVMDHVYGVTPPCAASCAEYAVPTTAFATEVVVIVTGVADSAMTVMLSCFVAVCTGKLLSLTCTVKVEVPAEPLGVPVIAPVPLFSVSPVGNEPEMVDHVYGAEPP
jgi:hypothetical protein